MRGLGSTSTLAILPLLFSFFLASRYIGSISLQCTSLNLFLGAKVSFPGSTIYNSSLHSYYSQQQQQLAPSCIVTPQTSKDVETAVWLLAKIHALGMDMCRFAIRSGGHTHWPGSANIHRGVTIDLRAMNHVNVNGERTVASIGAGATWVNVYLKLDAMELAVSGGRVADVGVGGLITGGGISFFSPRFGFVCDSVQNFQVVLASGKTVSANAHENSSLFAALKGGSNNFGIVTRFDLKAFPQGKFWGGSIVYPVETLPAQLGAFMALANAEEYDPFAAVISSSFYNTERRVWGVVSNLEYTKAEADPVVLRPFTEIEPQYVNTMRISNLSDFTLEINESGQPGARAYWTTTTFAPSLHFLIEVFNIFNTSIQPLLTVPKATYALSFQNLPSSVFRAALHTSPNSLGISSSSGLLINALFTVSWSDAADDETIMAAAKAFTRAVEEGAKKRGLWDRWVYLNYAAGGQDVMGGYGSESLERLRKMSREVDPGGLFQRGVPGGFKLWA